MQPICTECFVQIKRAEPHFPHDEIDPTKDQEPEEHKDPNLLVSEPANCPYCATPQFGITYEKPANRHTGINGIAPSEYTLPPDDSANHDGNHNHGNKIRRGSVAANDPSVITSDTIRPNWEVNLNKERLRLARKSANATAIHMSNQLIDPEHPSRHTSVSSSTGGASPTRRQKTLEELDEEMFQRALKLSLQDHQNH